MTASRPAAAAVAAEPGRWGPLTVTQEQLWALDRCTTLPAVLNLSYALAIDGPLDVSALAGAFGDVVRYHEPLRTTYPELGGGPVAEVAGPDLALSAVELEPVRVADPSEAAQLALADRARGFDLAGAAPIRGSLLELGPDRHVLLLTLHHIAADGWSLNLLGRQLSASYSARRNGRPRSVAGQPVECVEYAATQREWLDSPAAEREVRWWLDRLAEATPRPPVLGAARPADTGSELLRQVLALPDELVTELRTLGASAGASLYVLLLTAFEALIKVWSEDDHPVLGTLAAARPNQDSSTLLGAHYNPLLLNTDLGPDPSLAECLLDTSTRTMAALDHQSLPYPVLAARLERDLGWPAAGVPGAMLLLDRYPMETLTLPGCRVRGQYLDEGAGPTARIPAATTADLTFFVRDAGGRLTLSAVHRESLDEVAVAGALRRYVELLAAMCDSPEVPLSELTLSEFPAALPAPAAPGSGHPVLRDVTDLGPVEVLSPVGRWTVDPLDGREEGGSPSRSPTLS